MIKIKVGGGVIVIIACLFSIIAAFVTLGVGGAGAAFGGEGADTIIGLGWAGLFLSFVIMVLGAVVFAAKSKTPAILIIVLSLINVVVGGTFVAIFMVLSILGGILAYVGLKQDINSQVNV